MLHQHLEAAQMLDCGKKCEICCVYLVTCQFAKVIVSTSTEADGTVLCLAPVCAVLALVCDFFYYFTQL